MKTDQDLELKLDQVKRETLSHISNYVNKYSKEEIKILLRARLDKIHKPYLIDMFMYWVDEYFQDYYRHTEHSTPEERRELREFYTEKYMSKAEEVTGSKYYTDGKPKVPMFEKKENIQVIKLFKLFGRQTIENMITMFFNDSVEPVRQFVRDKKAGYSFSVFYSMVPKLSAVPGIDNKPCEICGGITKHTVYCEKSYVKLKEKEYEEIREEKVDTNLIEDFWKMVGGNHEQSDNNRSESMDTRGA